MAKTSQQLKTALYNAWRHRQTDDNQALWELVDQLKIQRDKIAKPGDIVTEVNKVIRKHVFEEKGITVGTVVWLYKTRTGKHGRHSVIGFTVNNRARVRGYSGNFNPDKLIVSRDSFESTKPG